MKLALVVFAAILAIQEDVPRLLRELKDGDIESREAAATSLVALGEKVRETLQRAAAEADPEYRRRLESVLKALDVEAERRKWILSKPLVTLSGEVTLQEVAKACEAAGGPGVRCDAWPEERFKLDLKDAPAWDALEAACRASGKATLICEPTGPVLKGGRYVAIPATHLEGLRLHVGDVVEGRSFFQETDRGQENFQFQLHLGWSGKTAPVLAYLEVSKSLDDAGNEMTQVLMGRQESIGHPSWLGPAGLKFHLGGAQWPSAKATRIVSLAGSLILYYRASDEPVSLRLDVPKEEATTSIQLVDERMIESESWPVSFRQVVRAKEGFSCSVLLSQADPRLRSHILKWTASDKDGKTYPGSVVRSMRVGDRETTFTLDFPRISDDVALVKVDSALPRRMIRRIVPFELKDIRIK